MIKNIPLSLLQSLTTGRAPSSNPGLLECVEGDHKMEDHNPQAFRSSPKPSSRRSLERWGGPASRGVTPYPSTESPERGTSQGGSSHHSSRRSLHREHGSTRSQPASPNRQDSDPPNICNSTINTTAAECTSGNGPSQQVIGHNTTTSSLANPPPPQPHVQSPAQQQQLDPITGQPH